VSPSATPRRGRLAPSAAAPARGERVELVVELPGLAIEQILSGELDAAASYRQAHDEWVVVLAGGARLEVEGEQLELAAGEWLLLPAGCAHTLLETAPGTSWLAVHHGRAGG
jgi:cupin 2 domain-containing protein